MRVISVNAYEGWYELGLVSSAGSLLVDPSRAHEPQRVVEELVREETRRHARRTDGR